VANNVHWTFEVNPGVLGNTVGPFIGQKLASITRRIAATAKLRAPVKSGNLARSIEPDPITFMGPFRAIGGVTAHATYAAAVEQGTRPHVIRPKHGQFLRFPGSGGGMVFARSVNHPGTRPRPFLRNSAHEVISTL
jgi:hypothetical protein